ncbi:hypothetical protein IPL68_04450 [Candidatus Saccharibacteria bacterium]|nr:MAG: hypothetical protein IPL68_04450 [Candidatus Saccharibacteria bacterium]
MNIGGTGGPSWDGEMNPRLKMTAVPYAFNAKTASQTVSSSGANLATLSIAAPTSGNQTFTIQDQGAAGNYNILTQTQIAPGSSKTSLERLSQPQTSGYLERAGQIRRSRRRYLTAVRRRRGIGTTNATSISRQVKHHHDSTGAIRCEWLSVYEQWLDATNGLDTQ